MKLKEELANIVPTANAICEVNPWLSSLKPNRNKWTAVSSFRSSLWNVDLIADNGDPDGRNAQTGFANRVDKASHMGSFFLFPILAVVFNMQNPSFVPTNFMTYFVGMLR
jgi:hypothetical protein